jgi:hypothetical protein
VKKISLAIAAAMLAATGAVAAELPSFEKAGLPVSAVQVRVLGAENVQEAAPAPTSATPVQLSVLSPRGNITTAQGRTETIGRAVQ